MQLFKSGKQIMQLACCIFFSSCYVYHMFDGNSKPVTFTADSSVFNNSERFGRAPSIGYIDLANLNGNALNSIELVKNGKAEAIIAKPTIFKGYGNFLVFPGEKLIVSQNTEGEFIFTKPGYARRNKELQLLNKFAEIEIPFFAAYSKDPSLDTMYLIENDIKATLGKKTTLATQLFDSLENRYNVSKKFRKETLGYARSHYSFLLFSLYNSYKDSLVTHGLFTEKCKELLPAFNRLSNELDVANNFAIVNDFANAILPNKIHLIKNMHEFESDFIAIEKYFTGVTKDYLLSQLIYSAYSNSVPVTKLYLEKYTLQSSIESYHQIINKIIAKKKFLENSIIKNGNTLVSIDLKKTVILEDLIRQNKGKVIVFDFMASWCAPCREDLPLLKELKLCYSQNEVVFLNISIDKQYQPWRKFIYGSNLEKGKSFVFEDFNKSPFIKQYNITKIPRYLVFDKKGNIVDQYAPRPTDVKLKKIIDSILVKP